LATTFGHALGGGVEHAFAANLSQSAGYLYCDLGKADYGVAAANASPRPGISVNAS